MTSFLQEQIRRIFDHHPDDLQEISIIIPNKRAAVYIQKYLAELHKKAFYPPEILTIDEWIKEHTDLKIISRTELLFILYKVHLTIKGTEESFEDFMGWGKTMISDFDEIDRYLISTDTIFRNLRDIKELESWDLDENQMGDVQRKFHELWGKLPEYYSKLEIELSKMNATYSGKAYANFYQNLSQNAQRKHYYFLGFNAVSKVEKDIMHQLMKMDLATVQFDVDDFYFKNSAHEARYFYNQICEEWQIKPTVSKEFDSEPKSFEIIETSQQVGQAKIAGHITDSWLKEGKDEGEIAIVLADESLLIPLTRSLPHDLKQANITMGWPIRFSHLKGFIDILFDIQFNFAKFKQEAIYHKDIIAILQHPYCKEIVGSKALQNVQEKLLEDNLIFVSLDRIEEWIPEFKKLRFILSPWETDNASRLESIYELNQLLYDQYKDQDEHRLDLEILYQFNKGMERFKDIIQKYDVPLKLKTFKSLFQQFWENETVSFLGNPIDGVQVMGILETRTIDFENLIIIGMNEGNLPKSTYSPSFIPNDLRLYLKLPTEVDKQAIFAHHFYRLISRAKNVVMTYNSDGEGFTSGERSRFITQLENEIDTSIHQWTSSTYSGENAKAKTEGIVYKSTEQVRQKLDEIFEKGLSPSALNKLMMCPLDFYYRYVLDFDEAEEIEESIENSTFGTKIHAVLEQIMRQEFEKEDGSFEALSVGKLKKYLKGNLIHEMLEEVYLNPKKQEGKKFNKSDLKYGQNKLSFDVSKQFIHNFIKEQIKELEESKSGVQIQFLERDLRAEIELEVNGSKKKIAIRGLADRIDKKDGQYRILDYKSGRCDDDKVKLTGKIDTEEGMIKFIQDEKKHYPKQLLMYALMFRNEIDQQADFSAGIISMVNISNWIFNLKYKNSTVIDDDFLEHFKTQLKNQVSQLYSDDFEFKHNPKSEYCQHCGK